MIFIRGATKCVPITASLITNMTFCWLFLLVLNVLRCHAFPSGDNSDLSIIKEQVAALTKRVKELEELGSDRRLYVSEENTTASDSALRQSDPVIVGFTAKLNKKLIDIPLGSTVIFDQVLYNAGSGYDDTTGIFTCPISGVYLFSIFVHAFNMKTVVIQLVIDGNDNWINVVSEQAVDGHDDTGGNLLIVHVVTGQRVWVRTYDQDNQDIFPYFTTFSGVLIQST